MDRPNQRKSESYGAEEVGFGRADWIDSDDHSKGILCRAFFSNFEPSYRPEPSSPRNNKRIPGPINRPIGFGSGEVEGTHFRQPSDPLWQELHGLATHSLRVRAYMSLKSWKRQFEVPVITAPPIA